MANAQVPQEKIPERPPFNPAQGPPPVTDALNPGPQASLIEKCVKQLVQKGLSGRPYVQDFLCERYQGRIGQRAKAVGENTFIEDVLPIDSSVEYFEHFLSWE